MQQYQVLENRLLRVKEYQRKCISLLDPRTTDYNNDYHYERFKKAKKVGNQILSLMVNMILDKENIVEKA